MNGHDVSGVISRECLWDLMFASNGGDSIELSLI